MIELKISKEEDVRAECIKCGYAWFPHNHHAIHNNEGSVEEYRRKINNGFDCPNEDCENYGKTLTKKNGWKVEIVKADM